MSRRVLLLVLTLGALPACEAPEQPPTATGQRADPVVYGADDRTEVYAHDNRVLRDLARRSVAALVSADQLVQVGPNAWQPVGPPMGLALGLCDGEPFADQIAGARCSGTLIAPDVFLTAGHCIDAQSCAGQRVVFDWLYEAEGQLASIEDADVYRCAAVLAHRLDARLDYAVVQLDRPVEGDRAPAELHPSPDGLMPGQAATLIGYPGGIPAKIADGGFVVFRGAPALDAFEASVDAFGGNSGSGVFDRLGGLIGVLVAGQEDYLRRGRCLTVNRLPAEPPEAEQVVYLHRALEGLCAARPDHALCDDGGGSWCDACDADADCRAGWRCVGTCVAPCAGPDDCIAGHVCADDGLCRPGADLVCRADARLRVDACEGIQTLERCDHAARCRPDGCLPVPPGETCAEATPLEPVAQRIEVDLGAGYTRTRPDACGGPGPDAHFVIEVDAPTTLTAAADGGAPSLSLRAGCDAEVEACVPAAEGPLQVELTPGVPWILTVSDDGEPLPAPVSLLVRFGEPCADLCQPGARRCADA
ncbi:MAG: trypsin-like peptidase domain-containing protein, partial [Myxococcales bacterium]|nr:trypsin-like peptidase domain-containing protein [Myxococcales bacterium]